MRQTKEEWTGGRTIERDNKSCITISVSNSKSKLKI